VEKRLLRKADFALLELFVLVRVVDGVFVVVVMLGVALRF